MARASQPSFCGSGSFVAVAYNAHAALTPNNVAPRPKKAASGE